MYMYTCSGGKSNRSHSKTEFQGPVVQKPVNTNPGLKVN